MCPDKQLLSVFFDGEVPSPWKEKIQVHSADCAACRDTLGFYAEVSAALGSGAVPEGAAERVWQRLCAAGCVPAEGPAGAARARRQGARASLWRRGVRVPLPFAIAAACILVVTVSLLLVPPQKTGGGAGVAAARQGLVPAGVEQITLDPFDFELSPEASAASISDIITLLETSDTSNVVIVKLPGKNQYNSSGEPVLLRAVDYAKTAGRGGADR
ncbi:MAG: hypothetical protein LBC72_05895 [Spirochaetaceae bacterium]|jgi:hypothetical protein|nr:hypothetical protein [Spirochaetaceae bacterium]